MHFTWYPCSNGVEKSKANSEYTDSGEGNARTYGSGDNKGKFNTDVITLGASKEKKQKGNDGSTTTTTIHEIATYPRAVFKIEFDNWPTDFNPPNQGNNWGLEDNEVSTRPDDIRISRLLKRSIILLERIYVREKARLMFIDLVLARSDGSR